MKTLFYGGTIITMADPLYAEAVLVEDEKIIAVGSEAELRTKADSFVNLDGATMLPGFIDSHSHLTEYAVASLQVNLDGITDFETLKKIQFKITSAITIFPRASGWSDAITSIISFPTANFPQWSKSTQFARSTCCL